mmetsp:Transcript_45750/g.76251  ORF Transcript_45750/g.76251 Transcript_45750/m.76251 type:complete len:304 (+) Transcript_45750:280-1191(+)
MPKFLIGCPVTFSTTDMTPLSRALAASVQRWCFKRSRSSCSSFCSSNLRRATLSFRFRSASSRSFLSSVLVSFSSANCLLHSSFSRLSASLLSHCCDTCTSLVRTFSSHSLMSVSLSLSRRRMNSRLAASFIRRSSSSRRSLFFSSSLCALVSTFSSSNLTTPAIRKNTAMSRAVWPSLFLMVSKASEWRSCVTMCSCPFAAERCSAVHRLLSNRSGLIIGCSSNTLTTSGCPSLTALCRGVLFSKPFMLMAAPFFSKEVTTTGFPISHAKCSGVSPFVFLAFTNTVSFNRVLTITGWSFMMA